MKFTEQNDLGLTTCLESELMMLLAVPMLLTEVIS